MTTTTTPAIDLFAILDAADLETPCAAETTATATDRGPLPGETLVQSEARIAVALGSTHPAIVAVAKTSPHFNG